MAGAINRAVKAITSAVIRMIKVTGCCECLRFRALPNYAAGAPAAYQGAMAFPKGQGGSPMYFFEGAPTAGRTVPSPGGAYARP
jgi:hypothetical protein